MCLAYKILCVHNWVLHIVGCFYDDAELAVASATMKASTPATVETADARLPAR
jgi:hypothetical protein